MHLPCLICTVLIVATAANAQSALIVVTHNDPDGIVVPGQTVRITVHSSWTQGWTLGIMSGDATASPDVGAASGPINGFGPGFGGAATSPGQAVLGSIVGFGAGISPGSQLYPATFVNGWAGIDALTYDWTAPSAAHAGVVEVTFEFAPHLPSIYLYPGVSADPPIPVLTTVIPTTLTVMPSPASVGVFGAAAIISRRRQRA